MSSRFLRRLSLALLMLVAITACGAPSPATSTTAATETMAATETSAATVTAAATETMAATETAMATTAATETAGASSATTTATAGGAGKQITVGMVLVGPINDKGYNQAHYEAMQRVAREIPGVKFIYVDKVNPSDRPNVKVEQVVDDLISQGANLIITDSDDFKDGTREAAKANPNIPFVHISGDDVLAGRNPPNLGNIFGKMEYGKLIGGCAAALTTKTGKISFLGALINDETRRLTNAAYLGARYCWTKVRNQPAQSLGFKVTWIGFWFNLPGVTLDATKVADDFINTGYDVNISGIDTTEGLIETRKAADAGKQVWAVAYDYRDGCVEAPQVCLGVPYFNWFPAYKNLVQAVQAGTWKPEWLWLGPDWQNINDPNTSTVGFNQGAGLSAGNKTQLDTFIKGLADGSIDLWQGPLNFQDGTPFLKAGEKATDKQIWYMPKLLQGVEGQSAAQR